MKHNLLKIANILQKISFIVLIVVGILGVAFEIAGHGAFVGAMEKIGIYNSFELMWIIGCISIAILLMTYFIKKKLE